MSPQPAPIAPFSLLPFTDTLYHSCFVIYEWLRDRAVVLFDVTGLRRQQMLASDAH